MCCVDTNSDESWFAPIAWEVIGRYSLLLRLLSRHRNNEAVLQVSVRIYLL